MEINQENSNNYSITEYGDDFLITAGESLNYPCCVGINYGFSSDNLLTMARKIPDNTELLIIGSAHNYPMQQQVKARKIINTEFMNIGAAIRTFNLLLSDNRSVVLMVLK